MPYHMRPRRTTCLKWASWGDPAEWDPAEWDPAEWDPAEWDPAEWDPAEWDPAEWDPAEWDPAEWDGSNSAGVTWAEAGKAPDEVPPPPRSSA